MVLKKFFKGKRKIGLPDTVSRSLPTEPSGMLAREFPPLASRAKSPSDVLDFVGHPRYSITAVTYDDLPKPSLPTAYTGRPQAHQQSIRPIPTPRRASFHDYSYDGDQQRKRAAATPPTLVMPQPIMAVPPTRDTVLRSTSKDKTLASVQGSGSKVDKEEQQQPQQTASPSSRTSCNTLQDLYDQLENYRLEHKEWLRRERNHQQKEEWMMMKLYDVQAQLDKLTAHVDDTRHQRIFDHDDYGDDGSSGYVSEEDEDEVDDHWDDQEDSISNRRRYYYQPMHPPFRYHHSHHNYDQHRSLSASRVPNAIYRLPLRHLSHHPLPPPPITLRLPPYPGYIYTDSWPPVRRRKPSEGSLPSVRKKNSIRRSYSTDRFHS